MNLPKFLLADHSEYPEDIFVVHTAYPRFLINFKDDEIEWFEEFEDESQEELNAQVGELVQEASKFYDDEVEKYEKL